LKQHKAVSEVMREMIAQHLRRISLTIHYAMAQDNNHGTSEAAALFIGGLLLSNNGGGGQARRWQEKGRYWLENRVRHLIEKDGSFSQYSVNYHRLMLDALCLSEVWRREHKQKPFSKVFYQRARAATVWLRALTCEQTGDVPNLGSNDGAWIMLLTDTDYCDFRPTVQLAAVLFCDARAYGAEGTYDQALDLLNVSSLNHMDCQISQIFSDGGYVALKNKLATTFLRFPKFRFRPSHCDALHLDLFVRGENILRDGGSYKYNCDDKWLNYFSGTESHNTAQFDQRNQMTKISRFLYGQWLSGHHDESVQKTPEHVSFSAGYTDWVGASHKRRITLIDNKVTVEDKVFGFKRGAVLRWRLIPGAWVLNGSMVSKRGIQIKVSSDSEVEKIEICEGWESRYYGRKDSLPVLEVTVCRESTIITEISWV
ncbi:MAG: heparinase II/III-family protein, partial [Aliivibrio sp.]|uniref:heparinase II/III family protein n=1 Tax=Aliivibrio sp. TaxID=1872443 RepID=UPI001A4D3088|nr:heparinase II/III-family protein [Aliivibrio sp.]